MRLATAARPPRPREPASGRRAGLWGGLLVVGALLMALSGCGGSPTHASGRYHDGLLFLATGDTTGTYYQFGGGYADIVSKYVSGYEMRAEATGDSGDNVRRIGSGDMDLALSHADVAADGVLGLSMFEGKPQRIVALARLYDNIAQVVIRTNPKIKTLADLRGKRVSTGTQYSGTDFVASRLLRAAGLDPDRDIVRSRLGLAETTKGMREGFLDAFIFVAGLPTTGVVDLVSSAPGQYTFLAIDDLLKPLNDQHNGIYQQVKIGRAVYNTSADVDTIAIPTMLVASRDVPDQLAYELTKVLFEHQGELADAHAEGRNYDKTIAQVCDPLPLHPGARRYYNEG